MLSLFPPLQRGVTLSLLGGALLCARGAHAIDLTSGQVTAIPAAKTPNIDGDLSDWNLNTAEPSAVTAQTARALNAQWALEYDDKNLYIGAEVSLPGRALVNPSNPQDAFWQGDLLQVRLAADPSLAYPLSSDRDAKSKRVAHISMWKNTESGTDYLQIAYGTKLDLGSVVNPPGSQIVITAHGTSSYTVEARIPWSALNAPGGVNPFVAGQKGAILLESLWKGGDTARGAAVYRENPGVFGFMQPQTWGQVTFAASAPAKRVRPTLAAFIAAQSVVTAPVGVGVPIQIVVPADGLKVSINVLGPKGEVIRELMGGEAHPRGPLTVKWDGRDQWEHPMAPGNYRYGVYFSRGLKAQWMGAVGRSGGLSGWGADHSNPIGAASDESGIYFLWPVGESSPPLVKTDNAGQVLWRKNPFVGGGFGPFYAVAADGKWVYLARGDSKPQLSRLDAKTGALQTWGEAGSEMPISESEMVKVAPASSPLSQSANFSAEPIGQPETVGLAARGGEVFASVYSKNIVQVLNAKTGQPTRTLAVAGPRGLALTANGDLLVASYQDGKAPQIVKFIKAQGAAMPVVTEHLAAPWGVAVDKAGVIYVSDEGNAQQVKLFGSDGKLIERRGAPGGRPWAGRYQGAGFRNPAGVATDASGNLVVAESAIPKVFTRWDSRGRNLNRWFGSPIYWNGTWPDPADPMTVYYQSNGGFARAKIPAPGATGLPAAYWNLPAAGLPGAGDYSDASSVIPRFVRAQNGRLYLAGDNNPNGIALVEGDTILPVNHIRVLNAKRSPENQTDRNYLELWSDANGDHKVQPDELQRLDSVEGKPLPFVADWFDHSSLLRPNGDFTVETAANKVLMIPAAGFNPNGSIRWNTAQAHFVVPAVLPSLGENSYAGPRGQAGLETDSKGNLYTFIGQTVPGLTPELRAKMEAQFPGIPITHWGAWETPEMATQKREGIGHTGEMNAVKFIKYAPDGSIVWMAGRKALAGARAGEIYHPWALAGMVGDSYVAGASEWGPIYFYTSDGFYVDKLMNDPADNPPSGPYTFGGETGTGRVQYFPKQDQVWAYAVGSAFRVDGFQKGVVAGERREFGTVKLDKIYDAPTAVRAAVGPLQIARVQSDPLTTAGLWNYAPVSPLTREDTQLATAQLATDDANLYARIHVFDATPLQNVADTVATAFKGGDTAGIVLGPAKHDQPGAGDVRIMAAQIGGQPRLIAMKAVTAGAKQPENYTTPAASTAHFDYVGQVPGGRVVLTPDADGKGYTAQFAVPLSFLEFRLVPGETLAGDVEVRLSGNGQRGVQATSRDYLFTPQTGATSMTDDLSVESRLNPQFWSTVEVK